MTATIDTAGLKSRVDLLALVGGDTHLRKVASTRGGEFAGPCPFCGGRDRFRVQPDQRLWWCRGCGGEHWQDAIAYVMRRDGVNFPEACRLLGADPADRPAPRPARVTVPVEDPEPDDAWRTAALEVVEVCEAALWSAAGSAARAWLQARGLSDDTLRHWRIGFSVADRRLGSLYVPKGITIPWFANGQIDHVNVRRPTGSDPKYKALAGGHPSLYGGEQLVGHQVAVLCEGEFDAMLLDQQVGDLVGVASLGSATKQLGLHAMRRLLPVATLLVAYDEDAEGRKGAGRLSSFSGRMRRVSVPLGKDVTDFHLQGGRVRDWIRLELVRAGISEPPEQHGHGIEALLWSLGRRVQVAYATYGRHSPEALVLQERWLALLAEYETGDAS